MFIQTKGLIETGNRSLLRLWWVWAQIGLSSHLQLLGLLGIAFSSIVLGQGEVQRTLFGARQQGGLENGNGLLRVSLLLKTRSDQEKRFGIGLFRDTGIGEEADYGGVVLSREVGINQPRTGDIIRMIELQGAPEPHAGFLHVSKRQIGESPL